MKFLPSTNITFPLRGSWIVDSEKLFNGVCEYFSDYPIHIDLTQSRTKFSNRFWMVANYETYVKRFKNYQESFIDGLIFPSIVADANLSDNRFFLNYLFFKDESDFISFKLQYPEVFVKVRT